MPTAILSDIHGNTPAFEAILADIERCGCSTTLILGDIINGFDPAGSLALVRGLGKRVVIIKGNAENYTLTPHLEELPDREKPDHANLIRLISYFRSRLTAGDLAWLAALPDYCMWQGACLVHDSPLDRFSPKRWRIPGLADIYQEWYFHSRGITERMPAEDWQQQWTWMEQQDAWGVFCGHTHVPFIRCCGNRVVCNVGAAGFPLDGDPRPSWVLLEGEPGSGCTLTIRRVEYDIERAIQMIDDEPDFHAWETPAHRAAYKKMIQTGIHWRVHQERAT